MVKIIKSDLCLKRLVDITVEFLLDTKIDLDYEKLRRPLSNSEEEKLDPWNLIAFRYFGIVQYKNAMNIYSWWTRNSYNYSSLVRSNLNKLVDSELMDFEETGFYELNKDNFLIRIDLQNEDLKLLESFINHYDNRSQFNTSFDNYLSEKLQKKGVKCWLRSVSNRFKKELSQNKSSPFWIGKFKCIDDNCTNVFNASIEKNLIRNYSIVYEKRDLNNFIKVKVKKNYTHKEEIKSRIRCIGNNRIRQGVDLMAHGISEVSLNNSIFNDENESFLDKKVTNRFTLSMIKSSLVHYYKVTNETFINAMATKNITDQIFSESSNHLKGFVQDVSMDPFGFLLLSQIQINVWNEIKKESNVLFFDSTGSIHKDVYSQKKPFFYSMIMHSLEKALFIPLFEFVTTANDQTTISRFLITVKNRMKVESYPRIIVTDMSWALINSVSNTFNGCDVLKYLKLCFRICYLNEKTNFDEQIKVKMYICSTHFLKNTIQKVRKIMIENHVRDTFIFSFTLIQNSISVKEVENYLINVYNLFNNKRLDSSVIYSLETLQAMIRKRNLCNIDLTCERSPDEAMRDDLFEKFLSYSNNNKKEQENNLKMNSPFTTYFEDLLKTYESKNLKFKGVLRIENEFYCPDLFDILKERLYLLPLWSGIMINGETIAYETKTRLSNNPVENYFGILKNKMFLIRKSTSELVAVLYKRLSRKYCDFFNPNYKYESGLFETVPKEVWKKKNQKKTKKKNGYFKNFEMNHLNLNLFNLESEKFKNSFKIFQMPNQVEAKNSFEKSDFSSEILEKIDSKNDEQIEKFKSFLNRQFKDSIEYSLKNFPFLKSKFIERRKHFESLTEMLRTKTPVNEYKKQKVYFDFKKDLNLDHHFCPVFSKPDGNCLYNSISILVFENEEDSFLIKACSIFTMFKYENIMRHVLQEYSYDYDFEELIVRTCRRSEWGNELNILSICLMLEKNIFCYNKSTKKNQKSIVKYSYFTSNNILRIGVCNNHFFPVLSKEEKQEKNGTETDFLSEDLKKII